MIFTTIVLLRPEGAADGAPLLRMELERDDWRAAESRSGGTFGSPSSLGIFYY